jgi:hypothetical protein
MISYSLPILETVQLAWRSVKGAKASFWGAYTWLSAASILFIVISSAGTILSFPALSSFCNFVMPVVNFLLSFGILYMGICRAFNRPISASMISYAFSDAILILKIFGLCLLNIVIIAPLIAIPVLTFAAATAFLAQSGFIYVLYLVAGVMLFLALYLLIRIELSWAFLLDKQVNPWQAIVLSMQTTRGNFLRLMGLHIVTVLITLICAIPLGIGLIWAIPFSKICYGLVYKRLLEAK